MRGWILYNQQRLPRNVAYAQLYVSWGIEHGIDIQLKMIENLDHLSLDDLPDFAIFRCEAFELRTFLEEAGCVVSNGSCLGLLGYDKLRAYEYMQLIGVPFLPVEPLSQEPRRPALAFPFVVKPRYGHGGQGVGLVKNEKSYMQFFEHEVLGHDPSQWLAQKLGPVRGKDLRVYVLGTDVLASMMRTAVGEELRSNYSLGGTAQVYELSHAQRLFVRSIIEHVGPGYYGLDFLLARDESLLFNEIEDIVGSRMLFDHTSLDVVDAHMTYVCSEVTRRHTTAF